MQVLRRSYDAFGIDLSICLRKCSIVYNVLKLSLYQISFYWYLTSLRFNVTVLVNTKKKAGDHSPVQAGVALWWLLNAGSLKGRTLETQTPDPWTGFRGADGFFFTLLSSTPPSVIIFIANVKLLSPHQKVNLSQVRAQLKQLPWTNWLVFDP